MAVGSAGGGGTLSDVQAWAAGSWAGGSHGASITHPLLADSSGSMTPYTNGYPTYVVIDRNMVIQQTDMWPWSDSFVLNLR